MIARASGKVGGKQFNLTLEVTQQNVTEKGADIQLVLEVTSGKEKDAVTDEEVVFTRQVEGAFEDVTTVTDHEGRAGHMFRDFGLGQHALKARCGTVTVSATITLGKETKAKKLQQPLFRADGDLGSYNLSVVALYEDGSPATNYPLTFLIDRVGVPADSQKDVIVGNLDSTGRWIHLVKFEERECNLTLHIGAYELKIENLAGPSRRASATAMPDLSGEFSREQPTGLLDAFRRGAELTKKKRERDARAKGGKP